jgi:hypothetical protein
LNLFCNKDTYEEGGFDTTVEDFVYIYFSLHVVWLLFRSLLDFSAPGALQRFSDSCELCSPRTAQLTAITKTAATASGARSSEQLLRKNANGSLA